ncbi:MAG: hypothetical protein COA78_17030 [Blastopirellula sp.]|nr:MAG: hypothetical protein COA78_17030 [Blastopirellula sp.]
MNSKLKTLSILYFVFAGLSLLMLLFLVLHYFAFSSMMNMDLPVQKGQPAPRQMLDQVMGPMKYMYLLMGFVGSLFTVSCLTTGFCFLSKKRHTLAIVGAGISCLSIPLGTALGVWALLVLLDENVKAEFK